MPSPHGPIVRAGAGRAETVPTLLSGPVGSALLGFVLPLFCFFGLDSSPKIY